MGVVLFLWGGCPKRTLKNSKKRAQLKKKEKTAVNKEIASLQKEINETDSCEFDEYWLY